MARDSYADTPSDELRQSTAQPAQGSDYAAMRHITGGRGGSDSIFRSFSPEKQAQVIAGFLASRGVPTTAQNAQMAREYLMGGAMQQMNVAAQTEADIADAAMAAEGGGAPASTPSPPVAAPGSTAPPAVEVSELPPTADSDGTSLLDYVAAPAAAVGAGAAGAAAAAAKMRGQVAARDPGIDGEVMPDDRVAINDQRQTNLAGRNRGPGGAPTERVVGVNYPQGGVEGQAAPRIAGPVTDVIDGTAVDATPQGPPPDVNGTLPNPDDMPITTEDVLNSTSTKQATLPQTTVMQPTPQNGQLTIVRENVPGLQGLTLATDANGGQYVGGGKGGWVPVDASQDIRNIIRQALHGAM